MARGVFWGCAECSVIHGHATCTIWCIESDMYGSQSMLLVSEEKTTEFWDVRLILGGSFLAWLITWFLRVTACHCVSPACHLRVTACHLRVTGLSRWDQKRPLRTLKRPLRPRKRSLRDWLSACRCVSLRVTACHLRVTACHLRVTCVSLRVTRRPLFGSSLRVRIWESPIAVAKGVSGTSRLRHGTCGQGGGEGNAGKKKAGSYVGEGKGG